jgi:flavin reductase (DIM6/NTAB) family NADH-FMN oxidoreductase RutF
MSAALAIARAEPRAASGDLRAALGQFATGIAVVTTRGLHGRSVGLTINSFSSVSLEPPLVLWSLSQRSTSLADFTAARTIAIHVLSAGQEMLARRFAASCADRFSGLARSIGPHGVPLVEDSVARFICTPYDRHETGDHVIFVVRVEHFEALGGTPLIFHSGRFRGIAPVLREPVTADQ